jgi:hypothetical protein
LCSHCRDKLEFLRWLVETFNVTKNEVGADFFFCELCHDCAPLPDLERLKTTSDKRRATFGLELNNGRNATLTSHLFAVILAERKTRYAAAVKDKLIVRGLLPSKRGWKANMLVSTARYRLSKAS